MLGPNIIQSKSDDIKGIDSNYKLRLWIRFDDSLVPHFMSIKCFLRSRKCCFYAVRNPIRSLLFFDGFLNFLSPSCLSDYFGCEVFLGWLNFLLSLCICSRTHCSMNFMTRYVLLEYGIAAVYYQIVIIIFNILIILFGYVLLMYFHFNTEFISVLI